MIELAGDRGEYVITDAQLAAISGASLAEVTLLLEREAERRHLELAIERVTNGTRISWHTVGGSSHDE